MGRIVTTLLTLDRAIFSCGAKAHTVKLESERLRFVVRRLRITDGTKNFTNFHKFSQIFIENAQFSKKECA